MIRQEEDGLFVDVDVSVLNGKPCSLRVEFNGDKLSVSCGHTFLLEDLEEVCRMARAAMYLPSESDLKSIEAQMTPEFIKSLERVGEDAMLNKEPYRFEPFHVHPKETGTKLLGRIMRGDQYVSVLGLDTVEKLIGVMNNSQPVPVVEVQD